MCPSLGTGGKRQSIYYSTQSQALLQRFGFCKSSIAVLSLGRGEEVCLVIISVWCVFILLHWVCAWKPCGQFSHPAQAVVRGDVHFAGTLFCTEVSLCVVAWAVNEELRAVFLGQCACWIKTFLREGGWYYLWLELI